MLKEKIRVDLEQILTELGYPTSDIVISIPQNPLFGDYTSNVALRLTKLENGPGNHSAKEIANKLSDNLSSLSYLSKVEVAGDGFINFWFKDETLMENFRDWSPERLGSEYQRRVLVEYGHVNLFKEVHIGHLRTFILGESICRILESDGAEVFRANYQGDIGLHIAKAVWGIKSLGLPGESIGLSAKAEFLGRAYAEGNKAYDLDPNCKKEIDTININLYRNSSELAEIYQLARRWSLDYLEPIYQKLGVKYAHCFFESEVSERGKQIVLEAVGPVFENSDGAVIFPGERFGLHNRVFVTQAGNPTYEAKEIGLAEAEYQAFNYDLAIHVVANEQSDYFKVVFQVIGQLFPHLKDKKLHLAYGFVDLKEGKMSSRTGDIVSFDDLYKVVLEKVQEVMKANELELDQRVSEIVAMGAIKFTYLKYSPQPNMTFDLERSVSLNGDSGPYVQYSYVRCRSILEKAADVSAWSSNARLMPEERRLVLRLEYFAEVIKNAGSELKPNLLCEYLLGLAHDFNLFYQQRRVLGSDTEGFRLTLTAKVADTLKFGLNLLGIESPVKM